MPTNDFLPFGLGIGANVLAPADWAADSERVMGFERGLAKSVKGNTAWRHCSFVTAGVAFLTSEALDEDVLDNGDLPGFIDQLRRAVVEVTGGPDAPDDGHTYVRMYRRWVLGDDRYLALLGGEMRGFITLHAPPVLPMHAANKQYIDDAVTNLLSYLQGNYLRLSGGTMQGFINLHAAPTQPMHAANKGYIDDAIANLQSQMANFLRLSGGTMQGFITLHAPPVLPMHAANRQYVDSAIANQLAGYLPLTGGVLYRAAGFDPLQIRADQGRTARISYHVVNTRIWSAGTDASGYFAVADETAGQYRFYIDSVGRTVLNADLGQMALTTYGGVTVARGDMWVHTSLWVEAAITATNIYSNHWIVNIPSLVPALCATISSPYFYGWYYHATGSIIAESYMQTRDMWVDGTLYLQGVAFPGDGILGWSLSQGWFAGDVGWQLYLNGRTRFGTFFVAAIDQRLNPPYF